MDFITNLLTNSILQVFTSFLHNWPFLAISVLISVALKLYVDPAKISALLMRYRRVGVVGATVAAVATPLCSCGTTAVVLGMMASLIPWAPIIAFMVASPLTSPEELIYSAGLFGWPFALAFFISSIVLGLLGGLAGEILERRGWLANQTRFSSPQPNRSSDGLAQAERRTKTAQPRTLPASAPLSASAPLPLQMATSTGISVGGTGTLNLSLCCGPVEIPAPVETEKAAGPSCGCGSTPAPAPASTCGCAPAAEIAPAPTSAATCGCSTPAPSSQPTACACDSREESATKPAQVTWKTFLAEVFSASKRLLVMFLGFAFIGYLLNGLIPSAWVAALFGQGNVYSVPLAATLGLPFYINTEGSLPLVRALIEGGMSQGAALAFLITGAGTSIGAVAGALTIARWRIIAVVIGTLWIGAVLLGYLYNALLFTGLF